MLTGIIGAGIAVGIIFIVKALIGIGMPKKLAPLAALVLGCTAGAIGAKMSLGIPEGTSKLAGAFLGAGSAGAATLIYDQIRQLTKK